MFDTQNPQPTDPPENTGGATRSITSTSESEESQATATDPPENTGGGTSE